MTPTSSFVPDRQEAELHDYARGFVTRISTPFWVVFFSKSTDAPVFGEEDDLEVSGLP